jgi:DNA-binding transcriptional LysR family regulator
MRPTVRAEGLAETLPRVLQQVARTIAAPEPFKPATSTRTFRLAAPDFIAPVLPTLLHDVQGTAPGIQVELPPYSPAAVRELAEGRHDALIAPHGMRNEDLRGQPLGTWPWTVYGREGHPAFADWSPEAWSAYPHLQVHTSGVRGQSPIDRRASQLGIRRVVGAMVPNFSMAAPILAQTDLLLTLPSVAMGNTAAVFHLDRRELPFDLPDMGLSLFRSAAEGDEPGVRWFHERVAAAFSELDESQ